MADARRPPIPRTEVKLREAQHFLGRMTTTQGSSDLFAFNLSAFLSAARSVTFVLAEESPAYAQWFEAWSASLDADDSRLLKFMNRQRVQEVHTKGADLVVRPQLDVWRPPKFEVVSGSTAAAIRAFNAYYRAQPLGTPTTITGGSTDFTAFVETPRFGFNVVEGKTADALTVCRSYRELLERLVEDFEDRPE